MAIGWRGTGRAEAAELGIAPLARSQTGWAWGCHQLVLAGGSQGLSRGDCRWRDGEKGMGTALGFLRTAPPGTKHPPKPHLYCLLVAIGAIYLQGQVYRLASPSSIAGK